MKTPPNQDPAIDPEDISKKIEDMLSVLEKRNKLIAEYYRSLVMPGEHLPEKEAKEQNDPVSP